MDILDLVHHPIDGKYIVIVPKIIDFDLAKLTDQRLSSQGLRLPPPSLQADDGVLVNNRINRG